MAGIVSTITISAVVHSVYAFTADPVADADAYFGARLGATAWTGAVTLSKQQALVTAVRMMDRRVAWSGTKTSAAQPLEWPRDGASNCGESVADGTVPDDIVHGEFELALALLQSAAIQNSPSTGSNVRRAAAGSAEVEFFVPTISDPAASTLFPQPVHELVHCYFAGAGSLAGPYVDGTNPDCCNERSHFDACGGEFGLTDPLA